jgi:hypothetical protein
MPALNGQAAGLKCLTQRRTIDGKMNPWIFESGPKYFVLDVIQCDNITVNATNFLFPRVFEYISKILYGFNPGIPA